jgi:hypothetical protein
VDGLLERLNRGGLYTQGYVDDLALLITGKFLSTVSELMQRALNVVAPVLVQGQGAACQF